MRTPYCAAIGLQRREVDQLRISIGVEAGRLAEVERRRTQIDADMSRERNVAAAAFEVPATAYFSLMRAERTRLEESQRTIDARVTQLRSQAREAYGSLSAVEGAADRYRDEETRRVESAEQAAMDDRSATSFLLLRGARAAVSKGRA